MLAGNPPGILRRPLPGAPTVTLSLSGSLKTCGVIVPRVIDSGTRRDDGEVFASVRSKQGLHALALLYPRVKPKVVVPRLQDDGHAIMERAHGVVRVRGEDCTGLDSLLLGVAPVPFRQPSGPPILRNRQTRCGKWGRHCHNCRRRMACAGGSSYKGKEGHETRGEPRGAVGGGSCTP
jgi:hypothetical protein